MDSITENSKIILQTAKDTVESFFEMYEEINDNENKKQDLLRAIILFSCSGIDAVIKQLINDALETIIIIDDGAENNFKSFVEKKIKNNIENNNSKLLSEIFTSDKKPKETLIQVLKKELTANSLQSAEELSRVASFFNIKTMNIEDIKKVFYVRNQITHEMDIDMDSENLNRRVRNKEQVKEYSRKIFELAEHYIKDVDKKLQKKQEE